MTVAVQNFWKLSYLTCIYWKTIVFQSLCKVLKTNKQTKNPNCPQPQVIRLLVERRDEKNQLLKFSAKEPTKIQCSTSTTRKSTKEVSSTTIFLNVSWRGLKIHDQVFWVVEALTVRLPIDEAGKASLLEKQHLQIRESEERIKCSVPVHREMIIVLRIWV